MFDIGFTEIILIVVVALLVVGPREFPGLVKQVGSWLGNIRQFANSVKTEFDKEIHKAEEIKQLMAREAEIAATPQHTDPRRQPAAAPRPGKTATEIGEPDAVPGVEPAAPDDKQGHGTSQT